MLRAAEVIDLMDVAMHYLVYQLYVVYNMCLIAYCFLFLILYSVSDAIIF